MARVILTFSQYHFIPTKKIKLKYDDKNYIEKIAWSVPKIIKRKQEKK